QRQQLRTGLVERRLEAGLLLGDPAGALAHNDLGAPELVDRADRNAGRASHTLYAIRDWSLEIGCFLYLVPSVARRRPLAVGCWRLVVAGLLDRLLAQAAPHGGLQCRDRSRLVRAIHIDRDALPACDTKREHGDQAFGVDQLFAMPDANRRLELLGDIDK